MWALSLEGTPQWTELTPSGWPCRRVPVTRQIYDPVRDRMVVFGGGSSELPAYTGTNDAWALSLGGDPFWTELIPSGTPPSARYHQASAYDPVRDRIACRVRGSGLCGTIERRVALNWF